jgi:3-methyl-2-oxobutanoate hydroxymethyltransferase
MSNLLQARDAQAVMNAGRFIKKARIDAIKLEGGVRVGSRIRAIAEAGILVIGHIGLTPQSSGQLGGHKAQGRTADSAVKVVEDALAVQEAGAGMLLVEAVPPEITAHIHEKLAIPVLSIGAGIHCDGQLLMVSDLIGQFQAFTPKFVKQYCNLAEIITEAIRRYCDDVRNGRFPEDKHAYRMVDGEYEEFIEKNRATG